MTFDTTDDGCLVSLEPTARVGGRERLTFRRVSDLCHGPVVRTFLRYYVVPHVGKGIYTGWSTFRKEFPGRNDSATWQPMPSLSDGSLFSEGVDQGGDAQGGTTAERL